jgi:hypothetical protein
MTKNISKLSRFEAMREIKRLRDALRELWEVQDEPPEGEYDSRRWAAAVQKAEELLGIVPQRGRVV